MSTPRTATVPHADLAIGLLLAALMAATRFHHFGSALHLPDASLAVFFLAGFYLRSRWVLPTLLAEAALIDYVATTFAGVSDWCITPAYAFLLPTYAALWIGGRWYARRHSDSWRSLLPLSVALLASTGVAFLISNGSFYWLSGRFNDMSLASYAAGVVNYLPLYVGAAVGYVTLAACLHLFLLRMQRAHLPAGVARP